MLDMKGREFHHIVRAAAAGGYVLGADLKRGDGGRLSLGQVKTAQQPD
jgi:hypothetical protein